MVKSDPGIFFEQLIQELKKDLEGLTDEDFDELFTPKTMFDTQQLYQGPNRYFFSQSTSILLSPHHCSCYIMISRVGFKIIFLNDQKDVEMIAYCLPYEEIANQISKEEQEVTLEEFKKYDSKATSFIQGINNRIEL